MASEEEPITPCDFLGVLGECYGPILQFLTPRDIRLFWKCQPEVSIIPEGCYCAETGVGLREGLSKSQFGRCSVCHKSQQWQEMIHCTKCPTSFCGRMCLEANKHHGLCDEKAQGDDDNDLDCDGLVCFQKDVGYWKCDYEEYTSGFIYECDSLYCPSHTHQRLVAADPTIKVFAGHCHHQRTKTCHNCQEACNPWYEECSNATTTSSNSNNSTRTITTTTRSPYCRPCAKSMIMTTNNIHSTTICFYEKYYDSYGSYKFDGKTLG